MNEATGFCDGECPEMFPPKISEANKLVEEEVEGMHLEGFKL